MVKSALDFASSAIVVLLLLYCPSLPFGTDNNLTILISVFIVAGLASSWNIVGRVCRTDQSGTCGFLWIGVAGDAPVMAE